MTKSSCNQGLSRRGFLRTSLHASLYGGSALMALANWPVPVNAQAIESVDLPDTSTNPELAARDESYWNAVRVKLYEQPQGIVQLEHGNWGVMAKPVTERYLQEIQRVNRDTSYYSRTGYGREHEQAMQKLADLLGVDTDELVPVRNATEALANLITGYNKLQAGDSVLYADLDYGSMQGLMNSLKERRGVNVRTLNIPEPASRESILEVYEKALQADRRIRLVLLTHLSHRTGLLIPVRELTELARRYDADVIVDAAHSWGQVDFKLPETGADFVGLNLHKWIGAPLGLGLMYVKRERFADIDRHPVNGGGHGDEQSLRDRAGVGTTNLAAMLSVPVALDIHTLIGAQRKQARLRFLRSRWAETLREDDRFEILTPADPALFAGITSFRLRDRADNQSNIALARRLLDEFNIFTVQRDGVASGACIRVTPAPFTLSNEIDQLVTALRHIA